MPTASPSSLSTNFLTNKGTAPGTGHRHRSSVRHCMTAQTKIPRKINDRTTAIGPPSSRIWPLRTYRPVPSVPLIAIIYFSISSWKSGGFNVEAKCPRLTKMWMPLSLRRTVWMGSCGTSVASPRPGLSTVGGLEVVLSPSEGVGWSSLRIPGLDVEMSRDKEVLGAKSGRAMSCPFPWPDDILDMFMESK